MIDRNRTSNATKQPNLLNEWFLIYNMIDVYYMAQLDVMAALHGSAILVATISGMIYRPRRGRIMETKQTTGTITNSTQHVKPCLIPQLLIRKFDPYRVVNAIGGH